MYVIWHNNIYRHKHTIMQRFNLSYTGTSIFPYNRKMHFSISYFPKIMFPPIRTYGNEIPSSIVIVPTSTNSGYSVFI